MRQFEKNAIHVALAGLSFVVAYAISAGPPLGWWFGSGAHGVLLLALVYAVIAGVLEFVFRVERGPWRFVSVPDALVLFRSTALVALSFLLITFIINRAIVLPRSALLLAWLFHLSGMAGLRLVRRAIYDRSLAAALFPFLGRPSSGGQRLLIVGEVGRAESFLRDLAREQKPEYDPVGLVALSAEDVGQHLRGVQIMGAMSDLETVLAKLDKGGNPVSALLFLTDTVGAPGLSPETVGRLKSRGVKLLRLQRVTELDDASVGASKIREISIEELLGRAPIQLELDEIKALIAGRRILVTGAGGSIGSELVRQAVAFGCAHITLIDNSEFALFKINHELDAAIQPVSKNPVLCDIRDRERLRHWFANERPDIVFHAAALKHVHVVERQPAEGILTNVVGTWNVIDATRACGASQMVLISTDKAVRPTSAMGATKRLAEILVQTSLAPAGVRFSCVRFGNVLGSAGSVVPIFREQIARGGPVTVTHPDVERFFMTIPEAVQLVLQTATVDASRANRSGIFILDMGVPVKIMDLAKRMIELHGKVPGVDVMIDIVGLRPGEKLSEELNEDCDAVRQVSPGVMEVVSKSDDTTLTRHRLAELEAVARRGDPDQAYAAIFDLIGETREVRSQVG